VPVVIVTETDSSDLDPNDFASILCNPSKSRAFVNAVDNAICGAGTFRQSRVTAPSLPVLDDTSISTPISGRRERRVS